MDFTGIAKDYARRVLNGTEPACKYVKLACKKFLDMLVLADKGEHNFRYSPAHAADFLAFFEELPLVEDNFRGVVKVELEPWMIFIGCNLYGFRDLRGFRYIKECYLEIPRKHFKSGIAAAVGLYDLRNPDTRMPLVLIGAATLNQADRVYAPMRAIIDGNEADPASMAISVELRTHYKLTTSRDKLECGINNGTVQKVTSIGEREDGWNPTTIILEELHGQKQDVYDVLKSAMGARGGQLLFQITTAGRNSFGIAWENRLAAINTLEGKIDQDAFRMFALIYTVDKEDLKDKDRLLKDVRIWAKANPMLNVSVDLDDVQLKAKSAREKRLERAEFYRTRLNIWTNAATQLFSVEAWDECYDEKLTWDSVKDCPSFSATDLSLRRDLTATATLFHLPDDSIAVFCRFFLPDNSPTLTDPKYGKQIKDWCEQGFIELTGEGSVDFRKVEAKIRGDFKAAKNMIAIGLDPAFAGNTIKNLEDDRLPVVSYKNNAVNMTAPTDDIEARISAKTIRHDGNPVLGWCIGNVHAERKVNQTVMPKKESVDSELKIDGAAAIIMANGLRMNPDLYEGLPKPSIYEKRGLHGANEEANQS